MSQKRSQRGKIRNAALQEVPTFSKTHDVDADRIEWCENRLSWGFNWCSKKHAKRLKVANFIHLAFKMHRFHESYLGTCTNYELSWCELGNATSLRNTLPIILLIHIKIGGRRFRRVGGHVECSLGNNKLPNKTLSRYWAFKGTSMMKSQLHHSGVSMGVFWW